jgi:hypothetical protein
MTLLRARVPRRLPVSIASTVRCPRQTV